MALPHYKVTQVPWYDVHGPAPFAAGIDVTVKTGFRKLANQMAQ